jgi:hypothetical protein
MLAGSFLILTDSGGIQEEAPVLGKPVLVVNEQTERHEPLQVGTASLVGTDMDQIVGATARLLDDPAYYEQMTLRHDPYGDGHAGERIADVLAAGAASSGERLALALERGGQAMEWIHSATAENAVPPTRLYLSQAPDDWRNAAIFSFDLAMTARGVAAFAGAVPVQQAEALLRQLGIRLSSICSGSVLLPSHAPRDGVSAQIPDRWSTRPGPHHLKAAGALLRLPENVLDPVLLRACRETVLHWSKAMQVSCPCRQLHPLFYGLEGLLIFEPAPSKQTLDAVERTYEHLLGLQMTDGSLPAAVGSRGDDVRADVLAQGLRIGAILRAAGRLRGDDFAGRLDALAASLLRHVRSDGGVSFSRDQAIANTWCAMFAHQALLLHSRTKRGLSLSGPTDTLI